jgi:hypothetical protein
LPLASRAVTVKFWRGQPWSARIPTQTMQ